MTDISSLMPFARTFIEIIALMLNPNKAIIDVFPAWNPIHGGNIRLPEPKNIEKNVIESNTVSFADNFFIIFPFFVFCVGMHSPEKRNGSSGLTARRSASVERCEMAVTRD